MNTINKSASDLLEAIEAEKKALEKKLAELETASKVVHQLINNGSAQQQLPLSVNSKISSKVGGTIKGRFAFKVLDAKPKHLRETVAIAEKDGVNFEGKKPGRVLHRVFYGLKQAGYAETDHRSNWWLTEKGLEAKQSLNLN